MVRQLRKTVSEQQERIAELEHEIEELRVTLALGLLPGGGQQHEPAAASPPRPPPGGQQPPPLTALERAQARLAEAELRSAATAPRRVFAARSRDNSDAGGDNDDAR